MIISEQDILNEIAKREFNGLSLNDLFIQCYNCHKIFPGRMGKCPYCHFVDAKNTEPKTPEPPIQQIFMGAIPIDPENIG